MSLISWSVPLYADTLTGHRNITSPSMLRHLNACQKVVIPLISPPLSLHCQVEHEAGSMMV
jgi:hypothetical protein